MLFTFIHCMIMAYLYGDIIEDIIYRDINRIGGVWHNWDYFMPPYTTLLVSYTLSHFYYGHSVHGAWRDPAKPVASSIYETG